MVDEEINEATREQLIVMIERIEWLEEEKKGITDAIKDVYSEAKSRGFDTKCIRALIKLRKIDRQTREQEEAILDLYKQAIGL